MSAVPVPIDDGIWRWTARHPEWHPGQFGAEVACFALDTGSETLLVDPLLPGTHVDADVLAALDDIVRDRVAILISIPYHTRSAGPLAQRYRATIHGHPAVAKRLHRPPGHAADAGVRAADARAAGRFTPVDPDAAPPAGATPYPGGARFFSIGRPRRFELPIFLPSHLALVFGDAVVEVGGDLRVWAQGPIDPRRRRFTLERFNPTLAPLLELGAERVLVTHGQPVLQDGTRKLGWALEHEPFWHHG